MNKQREILTAILSLGDIQNKLYQIKALRDADEAACAKREVCGKYLTKREEGYRVNILKKPYSDYCLLKAMSPGASLIQHWRTQTPLLCRWLQLSKRTLETHLKKLAQLGFIKLSRHIELATWPDAAKILDIEFNGLKTIKYNPLQNEGKQVFQYLITLEEIKSAQDRQLGGFINKLNKNLSDREALHKQLIQAGADEQQLYKDAQYFQERCLRLYMRAFREGSEILTVFTEHRPDINRGVKCIQKHHDYKSAQSVSYLKHRMASLGIISIKKLSVTSENRSRLYVPDENGRQRDGYKWLKKAKITALFLTDQITFNHEKNYSTQTVTTLKKAG